MGDAAGDPSRPRQARVDQFAQLPEVFRDLRMGIGRPVIVSIGGAGGMAAEYMVAMARILTGQILSALDGWGAAIVDGGTDSGVMRVMGRVRDATSASFPLIGVAPPWATSSPQVSALSPPQPSSSRTTPTSSWFQEPCGGTSHPGYPASRWSSPAADRR